MPGVGAELGGDDRGPVHRRQGPLAQLRPGRLEQQVAGGHHAAADHDHLGLEDVGEAGEGDPEPASRPGRRPPIAVASPAFAASVTALPSTSLPSASIAPSAESGSRSAASRPSRAERGARGVGLDAAVARAVALAGQAVHLDHDVAELGAGAGRAAVDLAVEDQAAADPGPDRQHHRVVGAAGGAEEMLGEGGDVGVVVDEDRQPGALADELADRQVVDRQVDRGDRDAAVVVDRRRDAETDGGDAGTGLVGLARSRGPGVDQLVLGLAGRALLALESDLDSGVENARRHLRSAEVDADRVGFTHRLPEGAGIQTTAGIGMISTPFMPENGDQQPSGTPDYKVYKSRKGFFSRLRKPDVPNLRDLRGDSPEKPGGDPGRRKRGGGSRIPRPGVRGKKVLKWVGIAAVGWILLSFLAFAVSAQLQAFKLSGEAKDALHGNPFLLPQRADDPGDGDRRAAARHQGAGSAPHKQKCFEQQSHGDAPHDGCEAGEFRADTLMLIRAGGGAFRKLSIPRDSYAEIPGQSPTENQRRLLLRRRQAADRNRRKLPRHRRSTTSRSSTSPASKT